MLTSVKYDVISYAAHSSLAWKPGLDSVWKAMRHQALALNARTVMPGVCVKLLCALELRKVLLSHIVTHRNPCVLRLSHVSLGRKLLSWSLLNGWLFRSFSSGFLDLYRSAHGFHLFLGHHLKFLTPAQNGDLDILSARLHDLEQRTAGQPCAITSCLFVVVLLQKLFD